MSRPTIILNGLPGLMAAEVADLLARGDEFELASFALSGERAGGTRWQSRAGEVELIGPAQRGRFASLIQEIPDPLVVDFTTPTAARGNVELYCKLKLPFIVGTSGWDIKGIDAVVREAAICAVVAPNMSLQIVALQAMIEFAAENFPELFRGYSLEVTESHQAAKRDTSGTAKAFVRSFNRLGLPFELDQITKIRDPDLQRQRGVPESALGGHAWHTYALTSRDGSVRLSIEHDVSGRGTYAEGTIEAIKFLLRRVGEGVRGEIFTMIDVARDLSRR